MAIRTHTLTLTPTGASGSASATEDLSSAVTGELLSITLTFTSQPGTTDVTITHLDGALAGQTIYAKQNSGTSVVIYPRTAVHDSAGAAISGGYGPVWLSNKIRVALVQGDAVSAGLVVVFRVRSA